MAIYGIGKTKVLLRLCQGGTWYKLASQEITLTREPNSPARLSTSVRRDAITPEAGDLIMLTIDDKHNQFLGVITDTAKSDIWCEVTAYDQIYYLNRNRGYMAYEDKKASELLVDIAKKNGLKMVDPPHVMDTGYQIPYRIEDGVSYLEMVTTALDLTFENTGVRFYLWDDCGNLCLHNEEWLKDQPNIIVSMGYITGYNYGEGIGELFTKVEVASEVNEADNKKGERTVYESVDSAQAERYGVLTDYAKLAEGEEGQAKADQLLKSESARTTKLGVEGCQGDIVVRGGTPVYVDFFSKDNREFIRGWYRTESVTHHIKAGHHTMDLTLKEIEMFNNWEDRDIGAAS